jgi:hypothetical protein
VSSAGGVPHRARSRLRARAAVFGLAWLALCGLRAAAEAADDAAVENRFDLQIAAGLGDGGAEPAFDLGLRSTAAAGPTPADIHAPPATARPVLRLPAGTEVLLAQMTPPAEPAHPTPAVPDDHTGEPDEVPDKPYGWKQLRYDLRYIAHRPTRLTESVQRALVAVAGTTALLYVFREDIQDAWRRNSSESRTDFLNSARVMGGGGFAPALALAAWGASFITDNEREKETAQLLLESAALSAAGAYVGSFVLAVERPEDGTGIQLFDTDGHGVSLDVSLAASVIPPLRRQYLRVRPGDGTGRRILKHGLSALLYSGMAITALQRVDADKHWAPDVFLGMVNGLGVGTLLGQARDDAERRRSRVALAAQPGGVFLTLTLSLDPR